MSVYFTIHAGYPTSNRLELALFAEARKLYTPMNLFHYPLHIVPDLLCVYFGVREFWHY